MSHLSEMKADANPAFESEFVKALEHAFGAGTVEVHETPIRLRNYGGDLSSDSEAEPCHIVIKKENVAKLRGVSAGVITDCGYRRDGASYKAFVDLDGFPKTEQNKVVQDYSRRVTEKILRKQGYTVKSVTEKDGTIRIIGQAYIG